VDLRSQRGQGHSQAAEDTPAAATMLAVAHVTPVTDVCQDGVVLLDLARQYLSEMRISLGSWQAVADDLAPHHAASKAAWWKLENGQSASVALANAVLSYHGLPRIPAPVLVLPCPDCGEAHTGRCYGKEVAAVAVLAPGEAVVARPTRKEPPPWVRDAAAWLTERRKAIDPPLPPRPATR
jgi:hypothetical protein